MYYAKNKRETVGSCNLCGEVDSLTWDHVQPKGGIELNTVEMRTVSQLFRGGDSAGRPQFSQNGLKYRTLCGSCNSLLGRQYDPTLNEFANSVSLYCKTALTIPDVVSHQTKPVRLIKAILGHLVAAKIDPHASRFDVLAREFVLSDDTPLSEEINIFYWIYPHEDIAVRRDFALFTPRGRFEKPAFCQSLKYFPVAYFIADVKEYDQLPSLSKYSDCGLDDEVSLQLDLRRTEPPLWPEEPVGNNHVMFGGQAMMESLHAVPRKRPSEAQS